MRKAFKAIMILSTVLIQTAQGQPFIKPLQYNILIERTVTHKDDYECFKWERTRLGTGCTNFTNPELKPIIANLSHCFVKDPGCINTFKGYDDILIRAYKNDIIVPTQGVKDIDATNIIRGETMKFYDTLKIFQTSFDISKIEVQITEGQVYNYDDCYNYYVNGQGSFSTSVYRKHYPSSTFLPKGDFYEEVHYNNSERYFVETKIKVIPNLDPTYTLPSHDKISISSGGFQPLSGAIVWDYRDALSDNWKTITGSYATGGTLQISGADLYGKNYVDLLNSTVLLRARSTGISDTTNVIPFTIRLSSPHITEVTPIHLDCFERKEGSVKIKFDRPLLSSEKINILLYDTLNRVNYSALNLSSLDADNTYTWKNELGAGKYSVSLLGKYAKGLEYDLNVNNRNNSVNLYAALNSINFEDGFATPDADDFNAFTDFTGYAQATYTGSINHLAFQELTQPEKIRFAVRVDKNILCKGAAAGAITVAATEGMSHYKYSLKHQDDENYLPWVKFDNNNLSFVNLSDIFKASNAVTQSITNLKSGKYSIRVRDAVDCFAKDSVGNEVTFSFEIKEPEKGVTVDLFEVSPITAHDASNGGIKLRISGGTPFATTGDVQQFPYKVEWRDSASNQLISNFQQSYTGEVYETSINNLGDGTYKLLVYDKSFNVSDPTHPHNTGCYLDMQVPVQKPKPLSVYIDQKTGISCHNNADGQLLAKASGGIPIDFKAYNFKWFKINGETATLLAATDSILNNAATGTYRVEVSDKYDNKMISEAFTLTQPEPLHLELSSLPASCYSSFNGSMAVKVTGGTPFANLSKPYVYEWSNGAKTAVVDKVAGGNYLVVVRDSMSCIVKDTVSVTSPVQVIASSVVQPITCFNHNDGQISVHASGGTVPYTYQWSNGANTASISNLAPGRYWYTVNDINGCFDTDTLVLDQPNNLVLNLGPDRKICAGQTVRFNASVSDKEVLTYQWKGDNGFTASTAKVGVQLAGTYTVSVANSRGCILRDTVMLTSLPDSVKAEFIVTTQAFANESVHFINISRPRADSVKWMIPQMGNAIRIVQQNNDKCELVFADTGRYEIAMRTYFANGCQEDSIKTINVINRMGTVNAGNQLNTYLKTIGVYPNPNNGQFTVKLVFSEPTVARLRLLNTLNNMVADDRQVQGTNEYTLSYNLGSNLINGLYLLVIDTPKGSFVFKVDLLK